jgi:hypothetical protein
MLGTLNPLHFMTLCTGTGVHFGFPFAYADWETCVWISFTNSLNKTPYVILLLLLHSLRYFVGKYYLRFTMLLEDGWFWIIIPYVWYENCDGSVGIALGYGLDVRGSKVWFLVGSGNFSLHHRVQNGSGAHPASYPMGTGDSFFWG